MSTNYVKFQRGSTTAYNNLQVKDPNTLYFIYDADNSNNAALYLGAKLISGGNINIENSSIDALQDVVINSETLEGGQVLIYDASQAIWKNDVLSSLFDSGAFSVGEDGKIGIDESKLISEEDKAKLDAVSIDEEGKVSINVDDVDGLDDKVQDAVDEILGDLKKYLEEHNSNDLAAELAALRALLTWQEI